MVKCIRRKGGQVRESLREREWEKTRSRGSDRRGAWVAGCSVMEKIPEGCWEVGKGKEQGGIN